MKKILMAVAFVATSLLALQSCGRDDERIDYNKLPSTAQSFITSHYPNATVTSCEKDYDNWSHTYEVYLSDGTHIEFDKHGEWLDVENRVSGVAQSVVPAPIWDYVATHYASFFIVDIEKDTRGYDVELNNDLDLDFDSEGGFVRVDN